MKKQDQKEIIRRLRRKYGENYRKNYSPTLIYLPKRVRAEVDQYCKEKEIVKTTWISRMVIKEMENNLKKKYDSVRKEFVESEKKSKKKKLD
jgi:flagellar motor switch protein FliG